MRVELLYVTTHHMSQQFIGEYLLPQRFTESDRLLVTALAERRKIQNFKDGSRLRVDRPPFDWWGNPEFRKIRGDEIHSAMVASKEYYDKALLLEPHNSFAFFHRASVQGSPSAVLADLRRAVKLGNPLAKTKLANRLIFQAWRLNLMRPPGVATDSPNSAAASLHAEALTLYRAAADQDDAGAVFQLAHNNVRRLDLRFPPGTDGGDHPSLVGLCNYDIPLLMRAVELKTCRRAKAVLACGLLKSAITPHRWNLDPYAMEEPYARNFAPPEGEDGPMRASTYAQIASALEEISENGELLNSEELQMRSQWRTRIVDTSLGVEKMIFLGRMLAWEALVSGEVDVALHLGRSYAVIPTERRVMHVVRAERKNENFLSDLRKAEGSFADATIVQEKCLDDVSPVFSDYLSALLEHLKVSEGLYK